MSKHNRNRGNRQQFQSSQPRPVPSVQTPPPAPSAEPVEDLENLLNAATGVPAAEEQAAPVEEPGMVADAAEILDDEQPKAEEPAEVVVEPQAEVAPPPSVQPAPAPQAQAEEKAAEPKKRNVPELTAEDVLPSTAPILRKRMNIPPRSHTPAGERLGKLFDEYAEMVQKPTQNPQEIKKRLMKLYQVMSIGCPASLKDAIVARDLVRVAFEKLRIGWGKYYTADSMFRLDYTLPGGPAAIDKLNMYWNAIIQLVDGAVNYKRVMFDETRLGTVLKNPAVTAAIGEMKQRIQERNASLDGLEQ